MLPLFLIFHLMKLDVSCNDNAPKQCSFPGELPNTRGRSQWHTPCNFKSLLPPQFLLRSHNIASEILWTGIRKAGCINWCNKHAQVPDISKLQASIDPHLILDYEMENSQKRCRQMWRILTHYPGYYLRKWIKPWSTPTTGRGKDSVSLITWIEPCVEASAFQLALIDTKEAGTSGNYISSRGTIIQIQV